MIEAGTSAGVGPVLTGSSVSVGLRPGTSGSGRTDEDGDMTARTPNDETVVAALCAALEPYPWRGFTPQLFARFALAARDRQALQAVLEAVPGTEPGRWDRLEPTAAEDARVVRLVDFLSAHRWTERTLPTLCHNLLGVLAE